MDARNVVPRRSRAVPSTGLGRKPTKVVKPGEPVHLSFIVDADIVQAADDEAAWLRKEHDLSVTRTDVLRRWLKEAAKKSRAKPATK